MIKNNNKGFTLIELLVVVLILGILAAMAMPQYFKAVERSRMSEAVSLMASIAQAQQRKYMQINKYTKEYKSLDVAPKGAAGTTYCTKGVKDADVAIAAATAATAFDKCGEGNGFLVVMDGDTLTTGLAKAVRTGNGDLQYAYSLKRFYGGQGTLCEGANDNGKALCADFCGIDDVTQASCCSDGTYGETLATGECRTPAGL